MKKVCILRHGFYPQDSRVSKEIDALIESGITVDILCLRSENQPLVEKKQYLNIFRLPIKRKRGGKVRYIFEYFFSFLSMFFIVSTLFIRKRYNVIQINTMPDFLIFAALIPKLFGSKLVLDLHEPIPELYITKWGKDKGSVFINFQKKIEQMAIKFSDKALTVTEALRKRQVERGANIEKIEVIPNVCDEKKFRKINNYSKGMSKSFTLITHGAIEERYGHELVIRAVNILKERIPNIRYEVPGTGTYSDNLIEVINDLDCSEQVGFLGRLPFEVLLEKLTSADVGIIPMYQNPYSELIDTNKMYEFIELGIPVIISRLPAIEDNFNDSDLLFFEPGNYQDLSRCIEELYLNPQKRKDLVANAYKSYEKINWEKKKFVYVNIINGLIS